MAAKVTNFATQFLQLVLNGTALASVWQDGTSPYTTLNVTLHTASPGVGGNQSTNEATYGAYARVAVARTTGGWTVAAGVASPVNPITFPTCTSGSQTLTHFGLGRPLAGASQLFYFGTITPNISVSVGITPQLTQASIISED